MNGFRLATVLRLRRTVQDQCARRAAAAHRDATTADERAATRLAELRANESTPGPISTSAFRAGATLLAHRAAAVRVAELAAVAAHDAHHQRFEELVQASMAVAALEKLEARAAEQAEHAERRDEAREIDDLVTARHRKDDSQ